MKSYLLCIVIVGFISYTGGDDKFYMPAEWEHQDAVWLGWSLQSPQYYPVIVNLIKTLTPHVAVKIAVRSDSLLHAAKDYLYQHGIDSGRVKFYLMPGDRYWIRDHGAAFLINGKGELGVADFGWSLYGFPQWLKEKYDNNQDSINKYLKLEFDKATGSVDSLMAVVEKATIQKTNILHEGGAIEVNGKGTLILCEATVLNRNPGQKKEEIENEFKRVLGVTKIIWMKRGLANDPSHFFRRIVDNYIGGGTGGHTDEFVRFANPNTIMLAWIDEKEKNLNPINKMNYDRMNENLNILEQSTDQDGKPFKIIKVPLPDLIVKKIITRQKTEIPDTSYDVYPDQFKKSEAPHLGDTLLRVPSTSYLNYFVTNGLVILPTYTQMGSSREKEEKIRRIFQRQFPNRGVVFINVMPQNWKGGGIHCSTQQQPATKIN